MSDALKEILENGFIALDTETTGLKYQEGDRVIEIGAVEVVGNLETGRRFHTYLNPYPRPVHPDAFAIHGITDEVLKTAPKFREKYRDFLEFIGDKPLVIHNASFDMGFLNEEFARLSLKPIQNHIIDSLRVAREKDPGKKASLDALCLRYGVDNSDRTLHGALIDSTLLARVFVKLMGFDKLDLTSASFSDDIEDFKGLIDHNRAFRPSRGVLLPSAAELANHQKFIDKIKNPVWNIFTQK